jgi:acetyl esterase/lipase
MRARSLLGRSRGAGVPVRHFIHAGMIHHFYSLGAVIPAAQAVLASIGAELREAFAGAKVNEKPEG